MKTIEALGFASTVITAKAYGQTNKATVYALLGSGTADLPTSFGPLLKLAI